jgi:uncharacterized membrane protein
MLPIPSFSLHPVHPILVNFTAALIPSSIGSDLTGKVSKRTSLSQPGWWMIAIAAIVTPLTAAAGLLWKKDVQAVTPPTLLHLHMWLGIGISVFLIILAIWRGVIPSRGQFAGTSYIIIASLLMGALAYQGSLGGLMAFGF